MCKQDGDVEGIKVSLTMLVLLFFFFFSCVSEHFEIYQCCVVVFVPVICLPHSNINAVH